MPSNSWERALTPCVGPFESRSRRGLSEKLIHLLRGDLVWIVMKCLEKDRTRRYETANALAMDVQRHFNNEPVLARPPSKLHRFDRLVRRNKLAFAAALAVALALVAGVALSSWQAVRARRAEKVARENSATAEAERLRAERASEALRLSSYVSEMNLAGRYCDEQNFADAWRLLQS